MDVDPGDVPGRAAVRLQDRADRAVAPGRCRAGIEQPVGMERLAAGDAWIGLAGHRRHRRDEPCFVLLGGWPVLRHQRVMHLLVDLVDGIGLAEVVEVAVEVDVVLVGPLEVREAVGVHRMDQQDGGVACHGARQKVVAQKGKLASRAGEAFRPVRARAHDEEPAGVGRADARGVGRDLLALGAARRMGMRGDGGADGARGLEETPARLAIAAGEVTGAHRTFSSNQSIARKAPPTAGRNQGVPE